jgi:hypothetical protein
LADAAPASASARINAPVRNRFMPVSSLSWIG